VSSPSPSLLTLVAKTFLFFFDSLFFLLVLAVFVEQVAGGYKLKASEDDHSRRGSAR